MRWHEIINEFEQSYVDQGRGFILDILSPLKAQGVASITVDQVIDQLVANPDLDGIAIDQNFVMTTLSGVKDIRIEKDPSTGEMTVFLDSVEKTRSVDDKQAEQERERIRQSAVRQAKKDD